jgi:hypothetical protein
MELQTLFREENAAELFFFIRIKGIMSSSFFQDGSMLSSIPKTVTKFGGQVLLVGLKMALKKD